jgi:hypothetical protein
MSVITINFFNVLFFILTSFKNFSAREQELLSCKTNASFPGSRCPDQTAQLSKMISQLFLTLAIPSVNLTLQVKTI